MSFRLSGTKNGKSWRVVRAIVALVPQIETLRGGEDHPSDGTVSSAAHDAASPTSDHREDAAGWVRAIDIGETEAGLIDALGEALRRSRDPRIRYWIHDRRMFSSYPAHGHPPYEWREYAGASPHIEHGHLSIVTDPELEQDGAPWQIGDEMAHPGEQLNQAEVNAAKDWNAAFGDHTQDTQRNLMAKLVLMAKSYPSDPAQLPGGGGGLTIAEVMAAIRERFS